MSVEKLSMDRTHVTRRIPTVRELRQSYAPKSEAEASGSWLIYQIVRPVSFYLTVPFIALGISANQVTAGGFCIGLTAVAMFTFGERGTSLIGSALVILWLLSDFIDGNIARYYDNTTHYGKFVDNIAETTIGALLPIGLAIGLAISPDTTMQIVFSSWAVNVVWVMAAIWSSLTALMYQLRFRIRASKFQIQLQKSQGFQPLTAPIDLGTAGTASLIPKWLPGGIGQWFRRLSAILESERSMINFFLPLFALADMVSVFIFLRCVTTVTAFVVEAIGLVRYAQVHLRIKRQKV